MRLKSGIWVAAYLRRCQIEGASAVLRRRGAEEAGAIFIKVSRLDGMCAVFGPAPAGLSGAESDRRSIAHFPAKGASEKDADAFLAREAEFDSDLWLIEVEDRQGRHFLDEQLENSPA